MKSSPWGSAFLAALKPRPRLSVSQWADRYRVIPRGTSPEPGPWHTSRVPYLRGIMDAINEPGVESVVVMMGSQNGKSECVLNVLGYFVDQDPAAILLVQPTIHDAECFSKERIEPSFRASPALRGKIETGKDGRGTSRKSDQTIRLKMFPGGYLALAGANSSSGLASRPIRVVLGDELDRWPPSTGKDGDPWVQAVQRTSNFHDRKIVAVSTPTIDGCSRIQDLYNEGDRRQYHVPCPLCGVGQVLTWDHLVYKGDDGQRDFDNVHYRCSECGGRIDERHKEGMLAKGEWIAQDPGGKVASFGDLSALYSPWVRWRTLAEQWCGVHDARDRGGLQEFVNLRLGQPFVETQQTIAVEYLERRREYYGPTLPAGVLVLTAGVDVQADRLELEVLGWGADRESWGVEYIRLMGDPSEPGVWAQLDAQLSRAWQTEDGRKLIVATTCVDSGYMSSVVYAFCRAREARRVWATKGQPGFGRAAVARPTRGNRFKAALFGLGVDDLKGVVMSRLRLDSAGPGHCHFPREPERGYDAAFFDGLLAEVLKPIQRGGITTRKWVKVRDRNEPLDCRVYATAALEILHPALTAASDPGAGQPHARRTGRRVLSRGVS